MELKKGTWNILSKIDCNEKIEKKNNLSYLSWAWAWGIAKTNFPDANYKVINYEGKPYLFDENLGYLVTTEVTISNETIPMSLFVMDGANKAQKHIDYTYEVAEWKNGKKTGNMIEKKVLSATMFDINTTIMRCLTKNLAMFGLGHYIYAGEDLPKNMKSEEDKEAEKKALEEKQSKLLKEIELSKKILDKCESLETLKIAYTALSEHMQKCTAKHCTELKAKLTPKK